MTKSSKASRYSDTNMKSKLQNVIIRTMLMYLNTPEKNNIYSFVIKKNHSIKKNPVLLITLITFYTIYKQTSRT